MKSLEHICTRIFAGIISLVILWLGYCNFINILEAYTEIPNDGSRIRIRDTISKIEGRYNDQFYKKNFFVNMNGLAYKAMGQRFMNGVFRQENGHLYTEVDVDFPKERSETVIALRDRLAEAEIPFLAVTMVRSLSRNDTEENVPILENAGEYEKVIKEFSNTLRENQISVLDLSEAVYEVGLERDDLFFKTDHHNTTQGIFWIYTKVVEKLDEDGFAKVDRKYTDINQFDIKVYPDYFMGSIGRRVGNWYAGLDDYAVITPKFETDCTLEVPSHQVRKEGTFAEAILSQRMLQRTDDLFTFYPYYAYIGADYGLAIIRNQKAPIDKTLAITKDSFMLPVGAFLSLCFSEVHIIDPRNFFTQNSSTVIEYLIKIHPDLVISQFSAPAEERFDFGL